MKEIKHLQYFLKTIRKVYDYDIEENSFNTVCKSRLM